MLRNGMMGWLTIMIDTSAWSKAQHAEAKDEIRLYKTALRPLIRDAELYHISPRPNGVHWDGNRILGSESPARSDLRLPRDHRRREHTFFSAEGTRRI